MGMAEDDVALEDAKRKLAFLPLVSAAAAATLLLAAVIVAFGIVDRAGLGGSERFRQLGQAANPFVAFLALAAVAAVVHNRSRRASPPVDAIAFTTGTCVALVCALLALNGVVVTLTASDNGAMLQLGEIVQLLATLGLSGFALYLAATAPTPRGSRPVESPPPSPPDGEDPGSRP